MFGFLKKPFKAIGKAFKKVGKFIKKKFQKLGKFMNKLGIVGQIGMMFLTAGAANLVVGGLMKGLQFASTSTGMLGTISKGVLKAVTTVKKLGTGLTTAFKGTVGSVVKAVGNVVTPTMKAIGEKLGMNFANPVLQSKGGAGLLDTIGQGIVESAKYSQDQFASLKAQGKGFFSNTVVDPNPKLLDLDKPSGITTPTGAETRKSLLELGGERVGVNPNDLYDNPLEGLVPPKVDTNLGGGMGVPADDILSARTGAMAGDVNRAAYDTSSYLNTKKALENAGVYDERSFFRPSRQDSLLNYDLNNKLNLPEVSPTKNTIRSSAQDMVEDLYTKSFSKDNLINAGTAAVTTSLTGLMTPPVKTEETGGQRFMGDSLNIGMEALATGGVTTPLQTAAFDYFNLENTNNRQANYFGTVG